mmetsp:Transcript_12200/g.23340  ORF Transcript_12200/g.23340 Transcript_12200/m.23340 type:complete len:309 (-) Transcript_12200:1948-2874(-)
MTLFFFKAFLHIIYLTSHVLSTLQRFLHLFLVATIRGGNLALELRDAGLKLFLFETDGLFTSLNLALQFDQAFTLGLFSLQALGFFEFATLLGASILGTYHPATSILLDQSRLSVQTIETIGLKPFQGSSTKVCLGFAHDKGLGRLTIFVNHSGRQRSKQQSLAVGRPALLVCHAICALRGILFGIPHAAVPSQHNTVIQPIWEDRTSNCDTRDDAGAPQLFHNGLVLHNQGFLATVGLDTPNVARTSLPEGSHEVVELRLVFGPNSWSDDITVSLATGSALRSVGRSQRSFHRTSNTNDIVAGLGGT